MRHVDERCDKKYYGSQISLCNNQIILGAFKGANKRTLNIFSKQGELLKNLKS